ncbi:hypothetical protein L207DRAFT_204046 [Hyaloscypha variabilis F]|uniref:Uncharacterized protein n=1 Tax=Hyaloscypha variabilis (strain UAMH 11265 / GT02V1 / F) TaxID=1149755 RepID=A0A2J6S597_HYAVF|nr:hypothetical protein L207DRAFT_204046 [Hyaloscypha variabilis F]
MEMNSFGRMPHGQRPELFHSTRSNAESFSIDNSRTLPRGPILPRKPVGSPPGSFSSWHENQSQRSPRDDKYSPTIDEELLSNGTLPSKPSSRLSRFSKSASEIFGIPVLYNIIGRMRNWNIDEGKKVVMDRSRGLAILRCFVHIIPITACSVLIALNTMSYYIGGNLAGPSTPDDQKLFGLQLAAKLLELFSLASIGAMILTHLRRELTFGDGLPFGAVFSAQQFHDISILWSLELWGAIFYKWRQQRKKFQFIVLIVTCAILALAIGPSSAILMRPRYDWWPAGGTVFWENATFDILFPSTLEDSPELSHCLADHSAVDCPAAGWEIITDLLLPFWQTASDSSILATMSVMPGQAAVRTLAIIPSATLYKNIFSLATMPFVSIANSLTPLATTWVFAANTEYGKKKRLEYRTDNHYQINTYQPAVSTMCYVYLASTTIQNYWFGFPNTSDVVTAAGSYQGGTLEHEPSSVSFDFSSSSEINTAILASLNKDAMPSLFWVDTTRENLAMTNSTLYAVAVVPHSSYGSFYSCCSIDTRLANSTYQSSRGDPTLVSGILDLSNWADFGTKISWYPTIYPSVDWTKYLNPTIQDANSTVFNTMLQAAGVWNSTNSAKLPYEATEYIITAMVANGIANINYNVSIINNYASDVFHQILPSSLIGFGGDAFNLTEEEKSSATALQFQVYNEGYAYSPSGKTAKIAVTVLAAYVVLAFGHIIYSTVTGWSSGSWGRASELTALAMKSTPTTRLHNIGAGIATVTSYTERTRVEIRDGALQIAFVDTEEGVKVKENRAYG